MEYKQTELPGVLHIIPRVFTDDRGFFMETWRENDFLQHAGQYTFVQENQSSSRKNVLRGLHFQVQKAQGKLVRCIVGKIFDVAVDLRPDSPTCGKWTGRILSGDNHHQLWIPPNFAHGFYTLSDRADIVYKCTEYYAPEYERSLIWNDPTIGIDWPLQQAPLLSPKDQQGCSFRELYPDLHIPDTEKR